MDFNFRNRLDPRTCGRALVAALAVAGAARADGASSKAMLSAYEEAVGGMAIARGDYAATVSQLATHGALYRSDRVAASTNLCVAYIMTREWQTAHAACDAAISLAQGEPADATLFGRRNHAEAIAVAYSNRAVLSWLEAQPESAASDMAQARALSPWSDFVAHNSAVLGAVKSAAAPTVAEAR
jgi:hypothetical protein